MPIFSENHDAEQDGKHHRHMNYVYSLADALSRNIPVTSIEFNPPVVSGLEKQEAAYWLRLEEPDEEEVQILKALSAKLKQIHLCQSTASFLSLTDSAAGMLRLHNIAMLQLLHDPAFTEKWMAAPPVDWEQTRTIVHLTRNHSVAWLRRFLVTCSHLGFTQLLLITGDPLKQMTLPTVSAEEALALDDEAAAGFRLKNSIQMLEFINRSAPGFFVGASHNPFLKREAAEKHLLNKIAAGARFIITQPVSYYDECWQVMREFEAFIKSQQLQVPIILGVFNYSVPCSGGSYKEEIFQLRYRFWKRLFGFVPEGVRKDYDLGLNGTEILARSINKLKRMGYYHFDVMNAEKTGWSVIQKGQRFTHESDRMMGGLDRT